VWENGWERHDWGWGAGILCQNCREAEIYNNIVAWNGDGISVIEQNREIVNAVNDVSVHDNAMIASSAADTMFALAWLSDQRPFRLYEDGSNNHGARNVYWFPDGEGSARRFAWNGYKTTLESFDDTPGDDGGRYLSDAEQQQLLSASGIPPRPEAR
jgi:hypothetical protein